MSSPEQLLAGLSEYLTKAAEHETLKLLGADSRLHLAQGEVQIALLKKEYEKILDLAKVVAEKAREKGHAEGRASAFNEISEFV